ncbi:DoxX family protein [Mesorhizobium sp. YR577]|jgi:hypothetical protein|uniref:DoxX family protein n=1 Tax=Mesorhizobium sp. YR577 TaxID=1884373 RepID=UPI0008ED74AC|nr:DoxX family protein [Mesorhizobium sp. YR577]SFU00815.1 DoxX-like family protein [Mesorhizobium sp. YR577]
MRKLPWATILGWALAAFFLFGSVSNILAPGSILEDYRRWGYPEWFHYVTGLLELTAAALLIPRKTRLLGAGLAAAVMIAAAGTVVLHGEYAHAVAPITVLAVAIITGTIALRARS